jgi:hypothetical protein
MKLQENNTGPKEDHLMWSFTTQPGLATTVLDFTDALAWLGVGLLGLTALAAWAIAVRAIRHQVSQRATRAAKTMPSSYREAA